MIMGCFEDYMDDPKIKAHKLSQSSMKSGFFGQGEFNFPSGRMAVTIHNLYIQYEPIKLLVDSCGATV
jgi:hypothetical protein